MKICIKYKSLKILLYICIYRIILDICYCIGISPIYGYAGYTVDASIFQYILSWLDLILMSMFFIQALYGSDRLWANLVFILLCMKFVPSTVLLGFVEYEPRYFLSQVVFWALFIILYNFTPSIKLFHKDFLIYNKKVFNRLLYCVIGLFVFAVLFVSIKYTGFHLHTSLFDVYDIRFEQRDIDYPILFQYILSSSTILCPLILCYFLNKKNVLCAILFLFVIYVDFSIAGLKSIVFASLLGLLLYKYYKSSFLYYLPICFTGVVIPIIIIKQEVLAKALNFILWRVLFVPSGMDYEYFTYFSSHEPDFYRNSIFRRFGAVSPYSETSVDIAVGEYFSPNIPGIRANNGLISEGFANFGIDFYFLMPLFLIIYIKFVSACSKSIDEKYLFLVGIIFAYSIISTFIPATLLSSGVIFMLLFLIVYQVESIK